MIIMKATEAMNRAQDLFADEYKRVKLLATWAMPDSSTRLAVNIRRNTAGRSGISAGREARQGDAGLGQGHHRVGSDAHVLVFVDLGAGIGVVVAAMTNLRGAKLGDVVRAIRGQVTRR